MEEILLKYTKDSKFSLTTLTSLSRDGLWCIRDLFKFLEEVNCLQRTNFVLANSPKSYDYYDKLYCLVQLVDSIANQELSLLTTANIADALDHSKSFEEILTTKLSQSCGATFTSNNYLDIELFNIVKSLTISLRKFYHILSEIESTKEST